MSNYKPITTCSPSRLKTFKDCSALYWAKYLDKAPDEGNSGSAVGTAVHDTAEILFNKDKWGNVVEGIIEDRIIPRYVKRYIKISLTKSGFWSQDNQDKAERFLLVALDNDFYLSGAVIVKKPEEEFLIEKNYKLKGFVDKFALYKDDVNDWYAIIYDYKSAKQVFTEEELENNIQAYGYLLYVKTIHPEINILKSSVKFIFLAYPEDPIQEFKIKYLGQLEGFEYQLEQYQRQLDSFKDSNKTDNMAAKQPWPTTAKIKGNTIELIQPLGVSDGGFKGPVMCGRAKFAGELKKNGEPMYYCKYKFPFSYNVLVDKSGKIVDTSRREIKPREGFTIETREYAGCEAFKYLNQKNKSNELSNQIEDPDFI